MASPETHRLPRRLALLRGRRTPCWSPEQGYYEVSPRTRVARALRVRLRRGEPVVLLAPRWSEPQRFLDDLATDLAVGSPAVRARTLSLAPLAGRTPTQAWTWLLLALREFASLPADPRASSAASSKGFHRLFRDLLVEIERDGQRRCLLLHGLEHAPVEALSDLVESFTDHVAARGADGGHMNLLLCGAVDMPRFEVVGLRPLVLADHGPREAVGALAEEVGSAPAGLLEAATAHLGGVPALLQRFGQEGLDALQELVADPRSFWRLGGTVTDEIRSAAQIATADARLAARLDVIARQGPVHEDPDVDVRLARTGLVGAPGAAHGWVALRAPRFADVV